MNASCRKKKNVTLPLCSLASTWSTSYGFEVGCKLPSRMWGGAPEAQC